MRLRSAQKSYKEIAVALNVSKGTVYYWLKDEPSSKTVKTALVRQNIERNKIRIQRLIEAMRVKRERRAAEIERQADIEFERFIVEPLFSAGITMYWGEGDSKPKNPLRLSNTDPRMIRLYVIFLKSFLKVPVAKIKIGLILYPDLKEKPCIDFWSNTAGLPCENFLKTQYIKGRHPTSRLEHGICMVIVSGNFHKIKVLRWIEIFSKRFKIQNALNTAGIS